MPRHKILMIGFGTVGQGFFELFQEKREIVGLMDTEISEIVDKKFGYIHEPPSNIIEKIKRGEIFEERDVLQTIKESDCDIVCELTWVNMKDAEPAYSHIKESLSSGKHVITTNKGPIALRYESLHEISNNFKSKLRFKGTVMSGTPSFNLLDLLAGIHVEKIRGIFNGTSNYILTEMARGESFDTCLKQAQAMGYAEADPTLDVDGFDAALKAIIVSKVVGWTKYNLQNIEIKGIRNISLNQTDGKTKLLVNIDKENCSVRPVTLAKEDLLSSVDGVLNAIELTTDTLGKILTVGPGAGKRETGQAVLSDLVEMVRNS